MHTNVVELFCLPSSNLPGNSHFLLAWVGGIFFKNANWFYDSIPLGLNTGADKLLSTTLVRLDQ